MHRSLIAFDTDHIKRYVFASGSRLKEIRGASALLDRLNREEMPKIADALGIQLEEIIYTNGGQGLFVVDSTRAESFGQRIQAIYHESTHGGASITYVIQELPPNAPEEIAQLKQYDLAFELELLRFKLQEEKNTPPSILVRSSHPFMKPCDGCGTEYTQKRVEAPDLQGSWFYYCDSCVEKQHQDFTVKETITDATRTLRDNPDKEEIIKKFKKDPLLWKRVLAELVNTGYKIPAGNVPDRPNDFNVFGTFSQAKDYLGLIYADGNNMGKTIEGFSTLQELEKFAQLVDGAIHEAMALAIKKHLPIHADLFPFDILLLGGDDIMMVVPAPKAMDVALTITQEFRRITTEQLQKFADDGQRLGENKSYTLSTCVVLAPLKYPFGLLQTLAESTLKFAKKDSAQARKDYKESPLPDKKHLEDDSRINFMIVTGGTLLNFKDALSESYVKRPSSEDLNKDEFHATLRSYNTEDLAHLLSTIRGGQREDLGRSKLHQLREAILKLNATTSVNDGMAVLRNWKPKQRSYVLKQVYLFNGRYELPGDDPDDPLKGFPRVTFPWFIKKSDEGTIYRTSLLDFVELYDFVSREEDVQE